MRSGDHNGAIEIHWLVYTFPGGNRNQQGGRVPLMWPAALCSGLAALSCGWAELWKNPPTLKKKKKKTLKRFSSSLNVMVGYLCVQSLPEWLKCLWVYWKGREPSWKTGIITQLSGKGTVESWLFRLVGPARFYASGNVCNLAPF